MVERWSFWCGVEVAACVIVVVLAGSSAQADAPGLAQLAGRAGCLLASPTVDPGVRGGIGPCAGGGGALRGQTIGVGVSPDGRTVVVLGTDRVGILRRDPESGVLEPSGCVAAARSRSTATCLVPAALAAAPLQNGGSGFTPEMVISGGLVAIQWSDVFEPPPHIVTLHRFDGGDLVDAGCLTDDGSRGCASTPLFPASGLGGDDLVDAVAADDDRTVVILSTAGFGSYVRRPNGALEPRACMMWGRQARGCAPVRGPFSALAVTPDSDTLVLLREGDEIADEEPVDARLVTLRSGPDGDFGRQRCFEAVARRGCAALAGLAGTQTVALAPSGRHLYALARGRTEGRVMWWPLRDGTPVARGAGCLSANGHGCSGGLKTPGWGRISFGAAGREVLISSVGPWGRYGVMQLFGRNPVSGALRSSGCITDRAQGGCQIVPGGWAEGGAMLSPDAKHVYVAPFGFSGLLALGRAVSVSTVAPRDRAGRRVTLALRCPSARTRRCSGEAVLRLPSGAVAGRGRYAVAPGAASRIGLPVRPSARRDVTLRAELTDAARLVRPVRVPVR